MPNETIHVLVSFDKHYISPFQTMLKSLTANNPGESFHIWLLHSAIPPEALAALAQYCDRLGAPLTALSVDRSIFENALTTWRYPQEMYYRLLAPRLLPQGIAKALYLDPDILVINPLRPLWDVDLGKCAFAASSHTDIFDVVGEINRVRLGTDHDYFNTGVILMDLEKARSLVVPEDIFRCINEHEAVLMLPDQDVFNHLYGAYVLPVDDAVWNYDARYYTTYLLRSGNVRNIEWVMKHAAILHFCGAKKPWGGFLHPALRRPVQALYAGRG